MGERDDRGQRDAIRQPLHLSHGERPSLFCAILGSAA
jgi:hypothetical protein